MAKGVISRRTAAYSPKTSDILAQIGHYLQQAGYTKTVRALVKEGAASGIQLDTNAWAALVSKRGNQRTSLLSFWEEIGNLQYALPSLDNDDAADVEEEEAAETSDDSSDEDDPSSPAKAGQKRKRQLTPDSSSDSSSNSSDSEAGKDGAKKDASSSSDSDSDSDSSSSDSDRRPVKRNKVSKSQTSSDSSSDSDSDGSSSSGSDSNSDSDSNDPSSDSGSSADSESSGSSSSSSSDSDSDSESSSSASPPPKKNKKTKKSKDVEQNLSLGANLASAGRASASATSSSATLRPESPVAAEGEQAVDTLVVNDAEGKQTEIPATKANVKKLKKEQVPFSRIPADQKVDPRFSSNAYVPYDYAERAHRDLIVTKGKGFTKEKNKKKRGSYRGGAIDLTPKGIKFED